MLGSTEVRMTIVREALRHLQRLAAESADDEALHLELARAYARIGRVQGSPNDANLGDLTGAAESLDRAIALRRPMSTRLARSSASLSPHARLRSERDQPLTSGRLTGVHRLTNAEDAPALPHPLATASATTADPPPPWTIVARRPISPQIVESRRRVCSRRTARSSARARGVPLLARGVRPRRAAGPPGSVRRSARRDAA